MGKLEWMFTLPVVSWGRKEGMEKRMVTTITGYIYMGTTIIWIHSFIPS